MQIRRLGIGSAIAGGVLGIAAMVGAGVGLQHFTASAQSPAPTPTATTKADRAADYLAKLAANLGVSVDQLKAANLATQHQLIDEAVAAGRLTAEQAAQLKERLAQADGRHFGPVLPRVHRHHPGNAPGGPGGLRIAPANVLAPVSEFLGIDPQTLMSELRAGKSLAQIAQERGKTRDELKAVLTAQFGAMVDQLIDRSFTPPARGPRVTPTPGT